MKKVTELVAELAAPAVAEQGCTLWDVEYVRCKRAHTDHIAIATHHRNRLKQMLSLVPVHYHTSFRFKFPCTLIHVEHNHIHAEIHGGLLCAQSGAQT